MASSSSSVEPRSIVSGKLYDVFISHRGPDVKQTLAKQLYDLFQERRCKPFLDREEIEGGDSITSAIHNAICSSRVQIAIFSKRFVESSWCLDEVVLMLQQNDALFIPLFYGVEPWELRHIDNEKSQYAKAFADYETNGRYFDKLDGWKRALESAADVAGYELGQDQQDMLEEIVSRVVQVVQDKENSTPLHVAKYPVGLDELAQDFERCCSNKAGMVGIFGLGGSGKTTLATELFNKKRSGYHRSCFLSDVRESHARGELHSLQSQLLKDLFSIGEDIRSVRYGMGKLDYHLGRARSLHFLIVVDDIDHQDQLDALLPKGMLGCGSLVIITTRDKSLLRGVDVRYEMKRMGRRHAKDLFCSHAFRICNPPIAYKELVETFVEFCGGLPLSLMVLGAHVYERDEYYWKLELEKVKKIPPADIMERLKISFDGLDREEKQIFIDVACFFSNLDDINSPETAILVWKACGWSAEHALQTLQDKCLIKISRRRIEQYDYRCNMFQMHDHLRDLGRKMGDEIGPPRLWQPQLLRSMRAKGLKQALTETKGRCFDQFIDLFDRTYITYSYLIADSDLVYLSITNSGHKLYNIPSWIPLRKLRCLWIYIVQDLWSSFQEQLETHAQGTFEMRTLMIHYSPSLQKLPHLIEMFSHLEELEIYHSLEKTDTTSFVQSLEQLSNLRKLCLVGDYTVVGDYTEGGFFRGNLDLSRGRDCSTSSCMESLETIQLWDLQNILKLVISEEMCPKLQKLDIRNMKNLKEIELRRAERLNTVEEITISGCPELQSVKGVEELPRLKSLLIELPDNRYEWDSNYIRGLRRLPLKKTILVGKDMDKASSKLTASLFSEVIDDETVFEIEREKYSLKMKSSCSAITIYAFLVTSTSCLSRIEFESGDSSFRVDNGDCLITIVLAHHESEELSLIEGATINKGFKIIVKFGEEAKALFVLRKIVDQLYTVPMLATYNVVK